MYRVLVVEDELSAARYLADLIPQCNPCFEVCGTAKNGADALDLRDTQSPDLVITDIRMPVLDGLELAARLHAKTPELPMVIVSGYEDFAYARRALGLGVVDYLMKPVERESLSAVLTKIEQSLSRERGRAEVLAALLAKPRPKTSSDPMRIAVALGSFDAPQVTDIESFEDGHPHRTWFFVPAGRVSQERFELDVKSCVRLGNRKTAALVFGLEPWEPGSEINEPHILSSTVERLRVPGKVSIHWGELSAGVPETLDGLFLEQVRGYLRDSSWKSLQTLVIQWASDPERSIHQSRNLIRQLLVETQREYLGPVEPVKDWEQTLVTGLEQSDSPGDVAELAWRLMVELCGESLYPEGVIDSPATLREICRWMGQHYSKAMSLQYVCSKFRISQSSLSRLFRKHKNTSFHDYLTEIRLAAADVLLSSHTPLQIKEVAFAVGYPDPSHFSRVYKLWRGRPPSLPDPSE